MILNGSRRHEKAAGFPKGCRKSPPLCYGSNDGWWGRAVLSVQGTGPRSWRPERVFPPASAVVQRGSGEAGRSASSLVRAGLRPQEIFSTRSWHGP